jgi:hypothetical protein
LVISRTFVTIYKEGKENNALSGNYETRKKDFESYSTEERFK